MKLTLLGTGVPAPSEKRAGSGYVVHFTDVASLVYSGDTDRATPWSTRQVDTDGVRERIVNEIAEIYGGRIIVGEDLKTIGTEASEIGDPL